MQQYQGLERAEIAAYPLEFSGAGTEYFRVWIVNVLLTMVTLGFYTPLARRRTAQYFYGHTLVADSPLEFTAASRRMMTGFLLFVLLYGLMKFAANTGQETVVNVMLLAGAALAPYVWGSAMRFRFNATRWRGVRLQFTATWGEVYRASWPAFALALVWAVGIAVMTVAARGAEGLARLGVVVALGAAIAVCSLLCMIRLEYNYKSLMVARGRIGGQPGRWKPVFRDFVRIWFATAGVFLASIAVVAVVLFAAAGGSFALLRGSKGGLAAMLLGIAVVLGMGLVVFLASAPARAYREARMFRLVWDNIGVSQIARFKCRLRPWAYVRLRVANILLTVVTLGFYRPFARVSEYRMKVESVTLHVKGGLDQLAGQLAREEQAVGDAIADALGLELVG